MKGVQINSLIGRCALSLLVLGMLSGFSDLAENARSQGVATLEKESGFVIEAQLRGRSIRLLVDPGAPGTIMLNGSVARSLALNGRESTRFSVGPVQLWGITGADTLTVDGVKTYQRIMWFARDMVSGVDGVINPASLPFDRVVMNLAPPRAGEIVFSLPVQFDRERGLYHPYRFGAQVLVARFTLADPLTTATGATAAVVVNRVGGKWYGDMFTHPVRYAIRRPVRELSLGQSLSIGGIGVERIAVRPLDDVGDYKLPPEVLRAKAGELLVIGKGPRRSLGEAKYWLMVGRNDLKPCSSLTYNRKQGTLTFRCLPAGPDAGAS